MADVKAFSNGNVSVWWIPNGGIVNINAPTPTEINAGVPLSVAISWENFELGTSDSDDIDDRGLMDVGNNTTRGAAQFAATLAFFRPMDPTDTTSDYVKAWEAFRIPRASGYLAIRVLQNVTGTQSPAAAGDDISIYKFIADSVTDDTEGDDSVKFEVNFMPQGDLAVYTKVKSTDAVVLAPLTLALEADEHGKVVASLGGDNISAGAVWRSSAPEVASVNPHGVVTANSTGTANITATYPSATGVTVPSVVTVS
jgi:hypothetical protein